MRFVILYHEFPDGHPRQSHWDFMLEWERDGEGENTLRTWALEQSPLEAFAELGSGGKSKDSDAVAETEIQATRLEDHRKHYLTYEGPISDDRGRVRRIASGIYRIVEETGIETMVELTFSRGQERAPEPRQEKFIVRVPRCEPGQRLGLIVVVGSARRDSS